MSLPLRLLLASVCFVATCTLAPFDFSRRGADRPTLFAASASQREALDLFCNLLLFVPVGASWTRVSRPRTRTGRTILAGAAFGAALSTSVELAQGWLPARDSSAIDVLSNTAGAAIGAWWACVAAGRAAGAISSARDRLRPAAPAIAAAVAAASLGLSAWLQLQSRLTNWDTAYPLVIGNELTGDRPWRGQLLSLDIRDGAVPDAGLRQFAGGAGLNLIGMPLTDRASADRIGGTHELEALLVPAAFGATSLVRRIRDANAFTVRARVATDDPAQRGPARIVSNSENTGLRNFTIGQQDGSLVVRLRTPATGLNGDQPELVLPGVFTDSRPRDLVVAYDGTTLIAAVAGMPRMARLALTPGAIAARVFVAPRDIQAPQEPVFSMLYIAALFVVPGVLVGAVAGTRQRLAIAAGWLLLFPPALEATLAAASGRPFEATGALTNLLAGAVVLPASALLAWRA